MHLRRAHLVLVAAIFAVGVLLLAFIRTEEPRHNGKTLSQWIDEARHTDYPDELPPQVREAEQAIRDMGPRAIPALLDMVCATDPAWKELLAGLLAKQRFYNPEFHWASERHEKGHVGFQLLGTNARPAIPTLTRLLVEPETARSAAIALAFIGSESLPVLVPALNHTNAVVRHAAIDGVFALGNNAAAAIPVLVPLLRDSDPIMASGALSIIAAVAPAEISLPLVMDALDDQRLRRNALAWLAVFGTNAWPAVPRLRSMLNDHDQATRRSATNALREIEQGGAGRSHNKSEAK